MSDERLDRLEQLLADALTLPLDDRAAFVRKACGDDEPLLREAEELLGFHDTAAGYFDDLSKEIAAAAALEVASAARPQIAIGPYHTLEAVGHGGMGAVYRAERVDGAFEQQVALKLLHRDMDTPQLRARFLAERQILARLTHPNIAHLQDGGVTDEGRPYFVMELVEGVPITSYCVQQGLSIDAILRLFLVVIDAVSYLHRNLVVHRDLKPSNILVDRNGQVKLLDFGIAKLLAEEPEGDGLTRTGERLMTPEYAAPEQLAGEPVTTATDVYALGVVLYELLTGKRPHSWSPTDPGTPSRELPPTPSSLLRSRRGGEAPKTDSTAPASGAPAPWRRVAGDLDTICLMALRPEPEARYPSAEQLGQDLQRHLEGLPVRARKSTFGYRTAKFAQRHRRGLLVAVALLVLVAAGFVRERGLRDDAERAQAEAQRQAARAVAVSDLLAELLSSVNPMKAQGREVTVADVLDEAAGRISDSPELAAQPEVEAAVRRTIGTTYTALGRHEDAREHLERAVELLGGLGSHDPEALAAASDLGALYERLGRYAEAETILREVLEVRVATLGEEHPDSLAAMNRLGDLMWSQGRFDELERLDRRTLEIRRRLFGDEHPDTLKSLNGLAATLFTRGHYTEAAQIFEQSLAVGRRILGEQHPHTLGLANNLAATYLELGRYGEAESLLREVIAGRTRVLGESHEQTAMSVHNLGVTLAEQARWGEAEEQLRHAVAVRETIPGDQQGALYSNSYLADVLRDQGRLDEAEALYLETIHRQREAFGADDGDTLKTMSGLAELRLRQGDLSAAEELVAEILEPQQRARGEAHPDTIGSLTLLARIRNRQGCFDEAEELSERAVDAGSKGLGADHPVVLHAAFEQARALAGLKQPEPALELAARIYEVRARLLGGDHPDTAEALSFLNNLRREVVRPGESGGLAPATGRGPQPTGLTQGGDM
jgi:eukaryotic-like serine/threonine-protein kinase